MLYKSFLNLIGFISLILGLIGIFLPLLPTTPFVLLAAWCFIRSSPKMHNWIYKQSILAAPLQDWEQKRIIKRKSKINAILFILVSAIFAWYTVPLFVIKILIEIFLFSIIVFIATRKEK